MNVGNGKNLGRLQKLNICTINYGCCCCVSCWVVAVINYGSEPMDDLIIVTHQFCAFLFNTWGPITEPLKKCHQQVFIGSATANKGVELLCQGVTTVLWYLFMHWTIVVVQLSPQRTPGTKGTTDEGIILSGVNIGLFTWMQRFIQLIIRVCHMQPLNQWYITLSIS